MKKIFPNKLKTGDSVRIVAPSRSLAIISEETRNYATSKLESIGLKVSFSEHCLDQDLFDSSTIEARIADLHKAFNDKSVSCILTVIGGFNSNQLLEYIDWELIKDNPKIFCGYSDITALNNAMFKMTGLVNYSGPHYSTFGQKLLDNYTVDYFKKCLFSDEHFELSPSLQWSEHPWWLDQDRDEKLTNEGWKILNEGECSGTIIGSNLCTLNLLQGTKYFPDLEGAVVFVEDDELSEPFTFDRDLQSLIQQPSFGDVQGLVIGRFQSASKMTDAKLEQIIKTKKALSRIPVIANVDFGHTSPRSTFPVGGTIRISATARKSTIEIIDH